MNPHVQTSIPEALLLARLGQSEQLREFFIQMWLQNPATAKQAGARVQEMLRPLASAPPAPTIEMISHTEPEPGPGN